MMTEDKAKIIDRIKKLLALATSDSIGEAASAAAKAQELMERHSIEQAMLVIDGESVDPAITSQTLWQGKCRVPSWILQLATGMAEINRCKLWYRSSDRGEEVGGSYIKAAGTTDSLEKMSVLMDWLIQETNRLYHEEKPDNFDRGQGKRWSNAFRLGASSTIVARLKEAAAKARKEMKSGGPSSEEYRLALEAADIEALMRLDASRTKYLPATVQSALVRLDNEAALAEAWVQNNLKLSRGMPRNFQGTYGDAYATGREAGKRANLDSQGN
jgi:hypothetical protein